MPPQSVGYRSTGALAINGVEAHVARPGYGHGDIVGWGALFHDGHPQLYFFTLNGEVRCPSLERCPLLERCHLLEHCPLLERGPA